MENGVQLKRVKRVIGSSTTADIHRLSIARHSHLPANGSCRISQCNPGLGSPCNAGDGRASMKTAEQLANVLVPPRMGSSGRFAEAARQEIRRAQSCAPTSSVANSRTRLLRSNMNAFCLHQGEPMSQTTQLDQVPPGKCLGGTGTWLREPGFNGRPIQSILPYTATKAASSLGRGPRTFCVRNPVME